MFGLIGVVKASIGSVSGIRPIHDSLIAPARRDGWNRSQLFHDSDCIVSAIEADIPSAPPTSSMEFDDGISLALFGAIYNDLDAEESPLAFVHRRYIADGANCFAELNGTFSLILRDARAKTVYLAVDRLATRPILHVQTGGHVLISPDLRSFTESGEVPKRVNPSALAAMLATRHMHGDDTYIQGVRSLNPGCFLEITAGSVEEKRYWDYTIEPGEDRGMEAYQAELKDLILRAVERRLRSGPSPALLLSGGVDCRAILGAARELGARLHLYSYVERGRPGSDPAVAEQIAKVAGQELELLHFESTDLESRIRDTTPAFNGLRGSIYEYQALRQLRGRHSGLLIGDQSWGGRGYAMESEDDLFLSLSITRLAEYPAWKELLSDGLFESLVLHDAEAFERMSARCSSVQIHDRKDYFYTMEHLPRNYLLGRCFLAGHVGHVLLPWLDNAILDFMRRTPTRYRMGRHLFRETARSMSPDLFDLPAATTQGNLEDWELMQHTLDSGGGTVEALCSAGEHAIDKMFMPEALRSFIGSARTSRIQALKQRVKSSDNFLLQRGGEWLSRQLTSRSSRYTRNLKISHSLTPWRVLETVAALRFIVGEHLGLELDEASLSNS